MSSNINDTISAALASVGIDEPYGYESAVTAVQEALAEREYTITETVLAKVAEEFGGSHEGYASAILADAGLASRPAPEPEADPVLHEGAEPLSVEDRLVMVETSLQGIAATQQTLAATLSTLTALAERLIPGSSAE